MLTRRAAGNILGEATPQSGNIFPEAMRTLEAHETLILAFAHRPYPAKRPLTQVAPRSEIAKKDRIGAPNPLDWNIGFCATRSEDQSRRFLERKPDRPSGVSGVAAEAGIQSEAGRPAA
jgi:hypothetical protein